MKPILLPVLAGIFLVLLFSSPASGACPLGYTPMPTTIVSPDGPYGSIFVETSPPGAVVFVNGINYGRAPATVTGLYKGNYAILVQMAGFQDYTTTTSISGPTRSSVYCQLIPDNTATGLYVMSTPPRANVYLDDVLRGIAPVTISNAGPGPHRLIVNLSGYHDWETTVTSPAAGTKVVAADLEKNEDTLIRGINVTSNPSGAKVLLDSREKGVTPLDITNIAAGVHILELEYTGYGPWKSTITVPETGMKAIPVNLTPKPGHEPGRITVSSRPGGASVTLDGELVGRTPASGPLDLGEIAPGDHTVVAVLSGYRSEVIRTTVSPGQVAALNATLLSLAGSSLNGTLAILSDPAGASVFIDNRSIGISPLTAGDIPAGTHEVSLRLPGYEDYSMSVPVEAGATRNVTATLVPAPTRSVYTPVAPVTILSALCLGILLRLRQRR